MKLQDKQISNSVTSRLLSKIIRPVNSLSELTAALSGEEKILNIQSDITLTSNISLPDGAIITYGGGIVEVGSYQVTFVNNELTNSRWNFFNGSIDNNSTFKNVYSIRLEDYGLVGDGNILTNSGTNNRNILLEVQKIGHITGCDLEIHKAGNYLYQLVANNQFDTQADNFYVTGNTNVYLGKDVVLGAITSPVDSYTILEFRASTNVKLYGQGEIVGELRTHDFITHGVSEGCFGVSVNRKSRDVTIDEGVKIRECPGDDFIGRGVPNFYHLNAVVEAVFTKDSTISDIDGTVSVDTDKAYTQRFSMASFEEYFVFGGGSFGGWAGIDVQQYYAVFYDNTSVDGDTTTGFISKTGLLETYEFIKLPENCTHIRLEIFTPTNWSSVNGTIFEPQRCRNIKIKSPILTYGVRQGISNFGPYGEIDGIRFEENGRRFDGTTGSPGYAIDLEDGYQLLHHVKIKNSYFKNNKGGDIILKGSRYIEIFNCDFEYNDIPGWVVVNNISLSNAEYTSLYGCNINDRTIDFGRGDDFYGNTVKDSVLVFTYENEHIHDIVNAENISFNDTVDVDVNGQAKISNSNFIRTRPLESTNIFNSYYNIIWENVEFDFKNKEYNSTNYKLANLTFSGNALGSMDKFKLLNLFTNSPHDQSFQTYVYDIKNSEFGTNLSIRRGTSKNTIFKNNKIEGWLDLVLTDYPSTNSGNFNTTIIENPEITIPDGSYTQFLGRCALTVAQKDINIEVKGGSITMANTFQNNILNLTNYGTKIFKGTKFSSPVVASQTLDSSYEFIDCEFENVTFSGVVFKYTYPSTNSPSYPDNATAVAALGVGYYYKDSSNSNKFEITY